MDRAVTTIDGVSGVEAVAAVSTPVDIEDFKARILAKQYHLSKKAITVVNLAIQQPEQVAFGTVKSLADRSGVTQATVLRSLKSMGFERFSDFRQLFRLHLRRRASIERIEDRIQAVRHAV